GLDHDQPDAAEPDEPDRVAVDDPLHARAGCARQLGCAARLAPVVAAAEHEEEDKRRRDDPRREGPTAATGHARLRTGRRKLAPGGPVVRAQAVPTIDLDR